MSFLQIMQVQACSILGGSITNLLYDWANSEELLSFEHLHHVSNSKSAVDRRIDIVWFYGLYFSLEIESLGLFCISLL